jgi:hypothetical protein
MVVWHLYDDFGNIVGLTQGYPIPSSLGISQTIFNLQENPTSLSGIPKFIEFHFFLSQVQYHYLLVICL